MRSHKPVKEIEVYFEVSEFPHVHGTWLDTVDHSK
jgi:hypothetical protein